MNIDKIIKNTNEINVDKTDWTKAWSNKYPILKSYQKEIDTDKYEEQLKYLINNLKKDYNYSKLDAMLVLKDILYHIYKDN